MQKDRSKILEDARRVLEATRAQINLRKKIQTRKKIRNILVLIAGIVLIALLCYGGFLLVKTLAPNASAKAQEIINDFNKTSSATSNSSSQETLILTGGIVENGKIKSMPIVTLPKPGHIYLVPKDKAEVWVVFISDELILKAFADQVLKRNPDTKLTEEDIVAALKASTAPNAQGELILNLRDQVAVVDKSTTPTPEPTTPPTPEVVPTQDIVPTPIGYMDPALVYNTPRVVTDMKRFGVAEAKIVGYNTANNTAAFSYQAGGEIHYFNLDMTDFPTQCQNNSSLVISTGLLNQGILFDGQLWLLCPQP